MQAVLVVLLLTSLYPLIQAWRANRGTSLIQAVHWAITAWAAWLLTLLFTESPRMHADVHPARYLALCLTGCAGVAVLGARRPHVGAWNFVVLGLLAVMLLPLAEGLVAGVASLGPLRLTFLGAALAVGIVNYLPTRFGWAALLLALACAGQMVVLAAAGPGANLEALDVTSQIGLFAVPWLGALAWRRHGTGEHEFDRLWLDFRNRFGLVWGQRVREQFNYSAEHAGWPVFLSWRGLRRTKSDQALDADIPARIVDTLKALLQRFGDQTTERSGG